MLKHLQLNWNIEILNNHQEKHHHSIIYDYLLRVKNVIYSRVNTEKSRLNHSMISSKCWYTLYSLSFVSVERENSSCIILQLIRSMLFFIALIRLQISEIFALTWAAISFIVSSWLLIWFFIFSNRSFSSVIFFKRVFSSTIRDFNRKTVAKIIVCWSLIWYFTFLNRSFTSWWTLSDWWKTNEKEYDAYIDIEYEKNEKNDCVNKRFYQSNRLIDNLIALD